MFKVFKRKSKTLSTPKKSASNRSSSSKEVPGVGDNVRPISYHFENGTTFDQNDDLPNTYQQNLDFRSFRGVDESGSESDVTVAKKHNPHQRSVSQERLPLSPRESPNDGVSTDSFIRPSSSLDDLLEDSSSELKRKAPPPPRRYSSLSPDQPNSATLPRQSLSISGQTGNDVASDSSYISNESGTPRLNGISSPASPSTPHDSSNDQYQTHHSLTKSVSTFRPQNGTKTPNKPHVPSKPPHLQRSISEDVQASSPDNRTPHNEHRKSHQYTGGTPNPESSGTLDSRAGYAQKNGSGAHDADRRTIYSPESNRVNRSSPASTGTQGVSDSESSASSDEPKADKTAQTFMESLMFSTSTTLPNVGVIQRNGKPHEGTAKEGVAKEVPNGQSSSQPATVMSFREAMKLRRVSEVQMMPQTPLTAQPVPLPTTPVVLPNTPKSLPNTHVSKPNTSHSIPSHALPSHTTPSKATATRSSTSVVEASDTPTPPPRKSRPKSRPPPPPTHPHTTVSYDFQTGRLEMVRSSSDVSTLSLTGSVSSISSPSELSSLSSHGSTTSPNASRSQHGMIKDTFISRSSPNVVPESMEPSSVIRGASRDLLLRDIRLNDAEGLSSETDMSMINSESESAMNSRKNRFHMLNQPNEVSEMYSKNDSDLNEGAPSLRSFRSISPVPNVANDTDLDTQSELALDLDDLDSDVTLESSLPIDDGPMNSSMLNESEMITISQSFINDSNTTYVSLLNGSQHNSVMVEDDYTPTNTPRNTTVREMTSDSWQKSLSQSWKPSKEDEIELCTSLEQPPSEQVANGENEGDDLQRDVVDDDVVIDDEDDDDVDDDDDDGSEKKTGPARWASFHSDTSVLSVVDYAWQTKPAVEWDNDDIIEWCQYVEFDDLAEVLADCGIDGAGFLEITGEDLADLCVPEEQRVQILTEIQKLKSKPQHAEPLSYLKQTSMRRRDLEASSDALQKRLSSLQQQNDRQQTQITSYLTELQQEQIRNTQLLSGDTTQSDEETRRSPQPDNTPVTSSQRPMPSQRSSLLAKQESRDQMERQKGAAWQKRPLVKWSMRDVSEWLTATDLVQFEPTFREHGITGKDLAQIDMKLFDTLSIQDVEDRELILSCLYELQLSGGPVLDDIFHSATRSRSPSSYSSSSSTHSHHHLHVKGLSINDSANSDPDIARSPRSHSGHSTLSVPSAVSPLPSSSQHSTPANKSGAMTKLNSQDSCHSLDIWHDIRGNFQKTVVTMAASSASTGDVIEALQEKLHIVEDPNLFLLHTASLDPRYQDDIKELGRYECPILLKELWPKGANYRFEVKRRPGTDIQVTCHLPTVKSRSKTVTVSNGTTCLETIALVSRQFKLTSRSSELRLLQAHEKNRHHDHVYSPTEDHELVSDIECDHFLLCEASAAHAITKHGLNKSQLSLSAKNSNQLAQMAEIEASLFCLDSDTTRDAATRLNDSHVTNTPSLDSGVASGAVTSVSDTDYTLDIDDLPLPVVPLSDQNHEDPYILNMAKSVSGEIKYSTPRSGSTHSDDVMGNSLELLQEIEVVKESVSERDFTIANLQRQLQLQNDSIAESDDKYEKLEKMTSQQEKTWQDKCHRLQRELNRAKKVEAYSDPHAKVDLLETELREITEQVQTQERNTKHMQQVMEKMKGVNDRPVDKTGLAEHVHQLSRADATLQLLRHEQSDIASHLDIARKHLPKKQMPLYSLYELAKSVRTPLLVTCEVNVHPSVGFLHGRDQHGRLVVKQTESSCDLQKGDKILEINNQAVTDLSDKEVSKTIRSTVDKLQIVVLREQPISKPLITKDELDGLKEDLALAVMELEAVQLENSDLNVDIVQLRGDYEALQDENSGLQTELSNLQSNEKRMKRSSQNSVTDDLNKLHTDVNGVLAYDAYDTHIPLWVALKDSPKIDVLQALRDLILETRQQKYYLDNLIAIVIDYAPKLLAKVDTRMGLEETSQMQFKVGSEEFC